jgi:hypothetical protein
MKKKQKKRGRPVTTGETKLRMLFSIDEGVSKEFKRHSKRLKMNMSQWIQAQMHQFNVENCMEDK